MRILGFMSGTSLDAIDMAILETDGDEIQGFGAAGEAPLSDALRAQIREAIVAGRSWERGAPPPNLFSDVAGAVALAHFDAARAFLEMHGLSFSDLDLIGFHGQTVVHEAPTPQSVGRTVQLGDGALLAKLCGVPVAYDFRVADVAAGGHGAPLAPIYHLARARACGLNPPLAILNIGGVANITLMNAAGEVSAFDTGPGNGLIDAWVEACGLGRFDEGGKLAAAGRVDEGRLAVLMDHAHFRTAGPKSLDRYDFDIEACKGLSPEDGAATLTAFTARAVALALQGFGAAALLVGGGGRRNYWLLSAIGAEARIPVITAERAGWRGDALEAEAFAYLAARTLKGLPISFPGTTGAPSSMTGGVVARP